MLDFCNLIPSRKEIPDEKDIAIKDFWLWFKKNEADYYGEFIDEDKVNRFKDQLNKIDDHLLFKFENIDDKNIKKIIFSPNKNRMKFSLVKSLVFKAPPLINWKFSYQFFLAK